MRYVTADVTEILIVITLSRVRLRVCLRVILSCAALFEVGPVCFRGGYLVRHEHFGLMAVCVLSWDGVNLAMPLKLTLQGV